MPDSCDVAVVGAGPAGLAAAAELKRLGVGSVVVLDREREPGGIPRHCAHSPYGMREFGRVLFGPAYARRLAETAKAAGAAIHGGVTVTALEPGPKLRLSTPSGLRELAARRVLLATGVREKSRAQRLIGGTKPAGIMTTGALQGFVHLEGLRPFRRPVVLGTELVAFSALLTCRHAGIRPVGMIEPGARTVARWPSTLLPRALGMPLWLETELVSIEGLEQVSAVRLCGPDGKIREVETDGVIVTGQFLPEASLLRVSHLELDPASGGPIIDQWGRCSDPDYFAAGNLLRPVETAGWSWKEGFSTARAIAKSLAGDLPAPDRAMRVSVMGDSLKFTLPQRIVPQADLDAPHRAFQLRLLRKARGRLALVSDNGAALWSKPLSSLPERRILVPIAAVPANAQGPLAFVLREEGR
ncbi:MAG TPA: FAD-dependent oxidoreductase [Mesorhizobium sp.]|nr:FAD-dependent oxidoreductase [Mesorhizobium sp.]